METTKKLKAVKVLETKKDRVHWGWYLFWLVMFAPMIMVVFIYDYKLETTYRIGLLYEGGYKITMQVDEKKLRELEFEAENCEDW